MDFRLKVHVGNANISACILHLLYAENTNKLMKEAKKAKPTSVSKIEHTHVDTELDAFPYLATHSGEKSGEALYPQQNTGIL